LTRKSGIDPHRFLEILIGTLFSAPIFKTYGWLIANEQYEPAGFKMALGLKDIRLALAADCLSRCRERNPRPHANREGARRG
jgi:3-hydroxyisobutyrate dehydrogenase-like beta-hydroxyacid dehydrogenase